MMISARALIFLFRYWSRRVNNEHFIIGQAVEVVDEEVDVELLIVRQAEPYFIVLDVLNFFFTKPI